MNFIKEYDKKTAKFDEKCNSLATMAVVCRLPREGYIIFVDVNI